MTRQLDIVTLKNAAQHYAEEFKKGNVLSPSGLIYISGHGYVMQSMYNFTFKDEFEFVLKELLRVLDPGQLGRFRRAAASHFEPRRDDVYEQLLREHLAIDPNGQHIPGVIGKVQLGNRVVGKQVVAREKYAPATLVDRMLFRKTRRLIEARYYPKKMYWPVYAGEPEERNSADGLGAADPLPEGSWPWSPVPQELFATNPRISNEAAIAACDAIVDRLDEGSTAATIRGRSGTQPADPDSAETGTLLFTLTMSATAFGAAADANPGGIATANAITDDSSADATGTLGYCRAGATGTGADDHIDGEAGTSGADFNFNTVSIVSGATVSMSSFTVTVPES